MVTLQDHKVHGYHCHVAASSKFWWSVFSAVPESWSQMECLLATLRGQLRVTRHVDLRDGKVHLSEDVGLGPRVIEGPDGMSLQIRFGPSIRLIIAGISPVSVVCADFARTLGFEVIVCDPREEAHIGFNVSGIEVRKQLPSQFIAANGCHQATAVVALTHDPVLTTLPLSKRYVRQHFISVLWDLYALQQSSSATATLWGLSEADIARLHMPIGLALGSKTPAEIALAAMADIIRVYRARPRDEL